MKKKAIAINLNTASILYNLFFVKNSRTLCAYLQTSKGMQGLMEEEKYKVSGT